jgi:site-specific recombinase XerC
VNPRFSPTDTFSANSYRQAIEKACKRAFQMRKGLTREAAREWRERNIWTPNQLRHLRATEIRRDFGIEAASVTLGHSNLPVTQTYAERDFSKAAAIARQIG